LCNETLDIASLTGALSGGGGAAAAPGLQLEHLGAWRGPLAALLNPVVDIAVQHVLPHCLAFLILAVGVSRFIPRLINRYGFEYFGYTRPYEASFFGSWLVVAVLSTLLKVAGLPLDAWSLPPLALMLMSLYGVWALDSRFQVIPDRLQVAGAIGAAGLLATTYAMTGRTWPAVAPALTAHLAAGLALPLVLLASNWLYEKLRHREAMGLGDIKLLAWLGLALGPSVYVVFGYALALASAVSVVMLVGRQRRLGSAFAFGPYIAAGYVVTCITPYWDRIAPVAQALLRSS
jgi:prepilin signal peptidase PulO-like enzyme (type II secretory pathway)